MIFANSLSIFWRIIVYIYATYKLMISSYNKIEIEPHCDQLEKEQTP